MCFQKRKILFLLSCNAEKNGTMSIAVAVGNSPTGPFVDVLGKPLIEHSREDIDPTIHIDDDGQAYLYWGNPNVYYVKLNQDMISYSGDIVKVASKPKNYQEGPWFYKRKGIYYLAYSSTYCPEGIGYCTSSSPIGPWLYQGLIMKGQKESAGNQPGIIDYKGHSYIFGFNAAVPGRGNQRRSVCADEFTYNADGTIPTFEWTATGPTQIGTLNPYVRTEAETIAGSAGISTEKDSITGVYVTKINNGDYIIVGGVDFAKERIYAIHLSGVNRWTSGDTTFISNGSQSLTETGGYIL